MRAGNLNKSISIESLSLGQDDFGQPLDNSWVEFKKVRASIMPTSYVDAEKFSSGADFAQTTHKIKIRYTDGINASMRAVWNNRTFDFVGVKNFGERNREIEITAKENINGK